MAIVIDSNIMYLQNRLNLSAEKLQMYQGRTVDQILEAEAAAGNQLAIELANELLSNPNLLIELFQLANPDNKFMILRGMDEEQLESFLPLMEKNDLVQGLNYFTQDKLLKMLEELPPEQLVKTVLELFSQEEVIQLMPEDQLDKLLTSTEIDKNKMLEHLKSIPPQYLAQIIESITGKTCEDMDTIDMVKQVGQFNPLEYNDALTNLQPTQKQQLVLSLVKQDPKLYQLFDPNAYTDMINKEKQKPEIVKAMHVIEEEHLLKMLQELPNDLMSIVITQIDTDVFAEQLIKEHPEIIAELLIA